MPIHINRPTITRSGRISQLKKLTGEKTNLIISYIQKKCKISFPHPPSPLLTTPPLPFAKATGGLFSFVFTKENKKIGPIRMSEDKGLGPIYRVDGGITPVLAPNG